MKRKRLIIALIMICLLIVGCKKEEIKNTDWVYTNAGTNDFIDEDIKNALADYNKELKPIAILGEQVVAGTNYMYLCGDANTYKIAVIYKDLEGKVQVTKVTDFDVKKYVNASKSLNVEKLVGGWTTNIPGKPFMLDDAIQKDLDTALEKAVGVTYYPIKVLATQEKDGVNYAILCYGKMSDANATTGVYLLTLYVNGNTKEIISIAAIDLKDYNN